MGPASLYMAAAPQLYMGLYSYTRKGGQPLYSCNSHTGNILNQRFMGICLCRCAIKNIFIGVGVEIRQFAHKQDFFLTGSLLQPGSSGALHIWQAKAVKKYVFETALFGQEVTQNRDNPEPG